MNTEFQLGKLYCYRDQSTKKQWIFHDDEEKKKSQHKDLLEISKEVFLVLDIKQSIVYKKLQSIKVLSKEGKVGRFYMDPIEWIMVDNSPQP